MRTTTGYFFMAKEKYSKQPLSIENQVAFLSKQGLRIENPDLAQHVLSVVMDKRSILGIIVSKHYEWDFQNNIDQVSVMLLLQ